MQWTDARQLGGHAWLNQAPTAQLEELSAQLLAGRAVRVRACLEASSRVPRAQEP